MTVAVPESAPNAIEQEIEAILHAGDPGAARARLVEALRERPGDQRARMFLFQLLCVDGEWAKAKAQLGALAQLSPEARMLEIAYGHAIDGEGERDAACRGLKPAMLYGADADWARDMADAFGAGIDSASELRSRALETCPDMPGEVDGRPFDYLFDGDGRFGPMFEAMIGGRWVLVPFGAVETIESEGPDDLRDLVWLPVEIGFRDGAVVAALLPARYPGTAQAVDPALRLARRTEWVERDGLTIGRGQRVWTTSGGEDVGILSFRRIRFASS